MSDLKYSEMMERLELCGQVMAEAAEDCNDKQASESLEEALSHFNDAEQRLHHLGRVHFNTTDLRKDDPVV